MAHKLLIQLDRTNNTHMIKTPETTVESKPLDFAPVEAYLKEYISTQETTYTGKPGKNPFVRTKLAREAILNKGLTLSQAKEEFPLDYDPSIDKIPHEPGTPRIDYSKTVQPKLAPPLTTGVKVEAMK